MTTKTKSPNIFSTFFISAAEIIINSRDPSSTAANIGGGAISWLATTQKDQRSISNFILPPLVLETYLDIHLLHNQIDKCLVLVDEHNPESLHKVPSSPTKKEIILERWLVNIDYSNFDIDFMENNTDINKNDYTSTIEEKLNNYLLKLLYDNCNDSHLFPISKLQQNLNVYENDLLKLSMRILDPSLPISSRGKIGLSKPIVNNNKNHLTTFHFNSLSTKFGEFHIDVSYRNNCDFKLLKQKLPNINSTLNININNDLTSNNRSSVYYDCDDENDENDENKLKNNSIFRDRNFNARDIPRSSSIINLQLQPFKESVVTSTLKNDDTDRNTLLKSYMTLISITNKNNSTISSEKKYSSSFPRIKYRSTEEKQKSISFLKTYKNDDNYNYENESNKNINNLIEMIDDFQFKKNILKFNNQNINNEESNDALTKLQKFSELQDDYDEFCSKFKNSSSTTTKLELKSKDKNNGTCTNNKSIPIEGDEKTCKHTSNESKTKTNNDNDRDKDNESTASSNIDDDNDEIPFHLHLKALEILKPPKPSDIALNFDYEDLWPWGWEE